MSGIEKLLTYAVIGVFLWIIIVILAVYSKNYFFDRLIKLTKEQRKLEKEKKGGKSKKLNPYYKACRDLFNIQMRTGQLKREKLLDFKDLINLSLGDKILHYKDYRFKNDCHEIYCKLKSETFNQLDYEKFIKFLSKNN